MAGSTVRAAHRILSTIGVTVTVAALGVVVLGIGRTPTPVTSEGGPARGAETVGVPLTVADHLRPVVVLYGDSLAWEARERFVATFAEHPEVHVVTRTFGGTAICDFLDKMRTDALLLQPSSVVVEFSGNAFTPCMMDAAGQPLRGEAYDERYRADAETVMGIFGPIGAHVWFAGAPVPRPDGGPHFNGGRLDPLYRELAARAGDTTDFVDAGAAVLDHGRWTNTLPCRPDEPCRGGTDADGQPVNVVRAPDGDHFCPASATARAGVTGACPIWSSGAFRYARAMAAPVIDALDAADA